MTTHDPVYARYWQRKRLRATCPTFPVIRCAGRFDGDVLRIVYEAIREQSSVLDVGAGDLSVRDALIAAGFGGAYRTLDVGDEHRYDYASLDQVSEPQDAILILDVIEHLPLRDGLSMIARAIELLRPNGKLVLQTPNGRCVRAPFTSDMTHLHAYNLPDLWAFVAASGCRARGYRVAFESRGGVVARLRSLAGRAVATQLLGLDYADNILLVAQRDT